MVLGMVQILYWGRGAVCLFLQDADSIVWVPEHLVHAVDFPVQEPEDRTEPRDQMDTGEESSVSDAGGIGQPCVDLSLLCQFVPLDTTLITGIWKIPQL